MISHRFIRHSRWSGHIRVIVFQISVLIPAALAQPATTNQDASHYLFTLSEAIEKMKSGVFTGAQIDLIADSASVQVIPDLKKQFAAQQDQLDKAKLAAAIVKLGDKDDAYWLFLVDLAKPALENDAPDFLNHDTGGKDLPGLSPEFVAWTKSHKLEYSPTLGSLEMDAVYLYPSEIMLLASAHDQRAVPLLRRALRSNNYLVKAAAAEGLAALQNKDAIPLIVAECKKAPADEAKLIARSLVYFDDTEAQLAVDIYIQKDQAKLFRDDRARGKKPLR